MNKDTGFIKNIIDCSIMIVVLTAIFLVIYGTYTLTSTIWETFKYNKVTYVISNPNCLSGKGVITVRDEDVPWSYSHCLTPSIIFMPNEFESSCDDIVKENVITTRIPGQFILNASGNYSKGTTFTIYLNDKMIYTVSNDDIRLDFDFSRIILERGKNYWLKN